MLRPRHSVAGDVGVNVCLARNGADAALRVESENFARCVAVAPRATIVCALFLCILVLLFVSVRVVFACFHASVFLCIRICLN